MALNQGKLLEQLEKLVSKGKSENFVYDFLELFGTPKATITRLKSGTDTRNIGLNGDVGLKKKVYFRASNNPVTLDQLDSLCDSDVVKRNDIRFVILTDFEKVLANDLTAEEVLDIPFSELAKNYHFFLPVTGQYEKAVVHSEHPADIKASEKMGQLFDVIRERNSLNSKEDIHALNVFLTRLLFCFYAEDTDIFKQGLMTDTIKAVTKEDGSDLDTFFEMLFKVLNLPEKAKERSSLPAHFYRFPYVNGGLFEHDEPIPEFGPKARRLMIECGNLNWSEINPDIFGSMFQAVIDPEQRGNLGQHYTSVSNIMKVIQPLFLDKLYEELDKSKNSKAKLEALLVRLQKIRVFDPACGSGNFLIIAYKELRKFEMEVFKALNAISGQSVFFMSGIQLSQFYGIEIDDFAHEIAILSLWLAEHQMNKAFAKSFGHSEPVLPLKKAGVCLKGNSLRVSWIDLFSSHDGEIFIIGNPPFLAANGRNQSQKEDMDLIFGKDSNSGVLDYVACWFIKAAEFCSSFASASAAFVSTNSICQGEQVGKIWPLIYKLGIRISFAYQPFPWRNGAKRSAGVHVIIVGFGCSNTQKYIFEGNGETKVKVHNVSPYLIEGGDCVVTKRSLPLFNVPKMTRGSQPTDGGHLILSESEFSTLSAINNDFKKFIRPFAMGDDFLNSKKRYCFWLKGYQWSDFHSIPEIEARLKNVELTRRLSTKRATNEMADKPHLFTEIRQPEEGNYLVIPRVSSESRKYIPIGFLGAQIVAGDKLQIIPDASLYHFGILSSLCHMDWIKLVAGRLESRYSYSPSIVYNNFPWPSISEEQRRKIEVLAEEVLLVREDYPEKTLAQLYDPDKMPQPLKEAHEALDMAVEALYRKKPFKDSTERVEHLFALYQELILQEAQDKAAKTA